ncbi:MAG TPA: HlyD family efflux transporter periplasmic adaptor subunit [Gemmatimonadales bacterium]|nr:HlyD family efflux transporter periplasmic adaptor subunit [Gemmatimonadales bacterium]
MQGAAAVGGLVILTWIFSSLRPAAPSVERAGISVDSVRRGEMVREVRGPGTLVPEHIRFITALASGRVERVLAQPGQMVKPNTVLLVLSNPDVEIQALQADQQLTAARAQLVSLRTNLETSRLTQEGVVATTHSDYAAAVRTASGDDSLQRLNLIAANDVAAAKDKASELSIRYRIEQERLALMTSTIDSQIAVQKAQVDRLGQIAAFQQNVVRSLQVTAGDSGVVSDLTLQLGQWVLAGTLLAKVVQPKLLLARLQIAETQAKDVALGQQAVVDTRNGLVKGHVIRLDPNSINGSVSVDVGLDGKAPGMRPDLSVDGTIEIERLHNVLFTGRPAYGQPNSTVGMFRITEDGGAAVRVPVQLGRGSATTVEVLGGLKQGDSVIVSDMSQWDNVDRVRLKR